ncbi:MAG: ribonuclease PH [Acidimicrobiales bacterium]
MLGSVALLGRLDLLAVGLLAGYPAGMIDPRSDPLEHARHDGRALDELRPSFFVRDFTEFAAGSVLAVSGRTKVLCTASIDEDVPRWMRGTRRGWVTAEYSLLPGSSPERVSREATKGRQSGRTQEIQRLIGRALRSIMDLEALGERQILIDCDVLQADGGTRTAAISGAYVALHDACSRLCFSGAITGHPVREACAAVSVGIVGADCMLDLDYSEDSSAEVDMNVVMTSSGRFVEVQGTAEGLPFARSELDEMLALAELGINQILEVQAEVLATPPTDRTQAVTG